MCFVIVSYILGTDRNHILIGSIYYTSLAITFYINYQSSYLSIYVLLPRMWSCPQIKKITRKSQTQILEIMIRFFGFFTWLMSLITYILSIALMPWIIVNFNRLFLRHGCTGAQHWQEIMSQHCMARGDAIGAAKYRYQAMRWQQPLPH